MKRSINCRGKLLHFDRPRIMGILNLTPDSFYDGGAYADEKQWIDRVDEMLEEGADILDLGAVSTRPGAPDVSLEEEWDRLAPALESIRKHSNKAIISIDTFRGEVARRAIENGADLINDISGGTLDHEMFDTIAKLQVPYVLMHIQGTPQSMQENPMYDHVVNDVKTWFIERIYALRQRGLHDLIVDLGFGFGKTVEHNYSLLRHLDEFNIFEAPILVGVSRKSMVNRVLKTKPETALNGTTALHMLALQNGASLLRVHDVKPAKECIDLWLAYEAMHS